MSRTRPRQGVLDCGLVLLHEDRHILVVDKPPGLLTIATAKERTRTVYHVLTDHVRKRATRSRNRVFIVHRLDRETSGLLVFAKTPEAKQRLQSGWESVQKTYLAVVHETPAKREDVLSSYLAENRAHVVYATADPSKGKLARTAYRVIGEAKGVALLEVDLMTGRKNQIRVQLADIGHPVVGDKKYGRKDGKSVRLGLHARSLSFEHPDTGRRLTFDTEVPHWFSKRVGGPGSGGRSETSD